jgi:arylsulfatase A-like enzyme
VQWNTDLGAQPTNLPKSLQAAGYATGMVGKWHNGAPPGWAKDVRNKIPPDGDPAEPAVARVLRDGQERLGEWLTGHGFDYAASANLGNFGAHPCRALRHHNQEWITQGALDFIDRNRERPFYLYMATTLLHGPNPLASLEADPRITHGGLLDEPIDVQPSRQSVLARARAAGVPERLAPATWLDDGIGAVLGKLDELGLAEDTIVFYFNDHGVEGGKGSCYEGGVRTPTFVRWKGVIEPGRSDALIQNIDFAPTILDVCGTDPPAQMELDGVSLMPLLAGDRAELHDSLFFEIGHTRAVCTSKWKYLAFRIPPSKQMTPEEKLRVSRRYAANKMAREDKQFEIMADAPLSHMGFPGGQGTERGNAVKTYARHYYDADQLYDLENDPGERSNLASDPAHRATLHEMKALLTRHLAGVPGTFAEFKTK